MEQQTNPFIESISINLFNGIFNSGIKFQNGLNIISGENGTGKTHLINQLKSSSTQKFFENRNTNRIVVFNPLRNAEKRTQEQIVQRLRSQDLSLKKINDLLRGFAINDQALTTYYSFGEVFVLAYEDILYNGDITVHDAVLQTRDEFSQVLQRVFPQYEIIAEWENKQLYLSVKKQQNIVIPLNALSRGENEVFALLFSIYAIRNQEDIFLIDEPELHLNWDLERGLFRFLNWFCEEHKKQIIVATHSRIVFESEFLPKTQFLVWENGHIMVKNQPTDLIKEKIGGDALQLVTALDINKAVFYVEDNEHEKVVEYLARQFSKDLFVSATKNRENVRNLCRYFTKEGRKNAYFLVDGDNESVPQEFLNNDQYIQLQKYCIENYFLEPNLLAEASNKTIEEVKTAIKNAIVEISSDKHSIVFIRLAEKEELTFDILDTFDASKIIENISIKLGFTDKYSLINIFLEKCKEKGRLEEIFGEMTNVIKEI